MTSNVTHLSRKSVKIAKQTNCGESETFTQAFLPYSSAMINPPLTYCRKADIAAVKSTKSGVKDGPGRHHGNVIGVS